MESVFTSVTYLSEWTASPLTRGQLAAGGLFLTFRILIWTEGELFSRRLAHFVNQLTCLRHSDEYCA